MCDPEVFSSLDFIEISTLSFELCPSNKIQLKSDGSIQEHNVPDRDVSGITVQRIRITKCLIRHLKMVLEE